ncbi:MAG: nuclear transport factor 2 family protein [bacterium]|nr:nuclear transport factor 2 family protein [bacterium]
MSDDDRLGKIEDRNAILDLLVTYCHRIAAADVEGVLALFEEDAVVEVLGERYAGWDGLRALYAASLPVEPKPFLHNHLLDSLEGERARTRSVFEIRQQRDGQAESSIGCYEDEFLKRGGRWRFCRRVFQFY